MVKNVLRRKNFEMLKENGSSSIEAALVMPVVFIVILCIVYMSMYMHDIVIMKAACVNGCELVEGGNLEEKEAINSIKSKLIEKTLIVKNIDVSCNSDNKIVFETSGDICIPFDVVLKLNGSDKAQVKCELKRKIDKSLIYKKMILDNGISKIEQGGD